MNFRAIAASPASPVSTGPLFFPDHFQFSGYDPVCYCVNSSIYCCLYLKTSHQKVVAKKELVSTHAPSANHRCPIPRPTMNPLRANTQSSPYLRSWRMLSDDISIMMCACFTFSVVVVFLSVVAAFQDSPPNLLCRKSLPRSRLFNSTINYYGNDSKIS